MMFSIHFGQKRLCYYNTSVVAEKCLNDTVLNVYNFIKHINNDFILYTY